MPLRIRDLREDSDLSQKEIAKFLHVSQATYSRYENGELEISIPTLTALADFYHKNQLSRNSGAKTVKV